MSTHLRTLLLDATWRPVRILPWEQGLLLSHAEFRGRAQVIENYAARVQSARREFIVPAVIALREFHGFHRFRVRWNGKALFKRDAYTCQYCSFRYPGDQLTVDHVKPRAQGGRSLWENTVTACRPCNERKADRTPDQAGMPLLCQPKQPVSVGIARFAGPTPPEWSSYLRS